jgi:hypothetical protein
MRFRGEWPCHGPDAKRRSADAKFKDGDVLVIEPWRARAPSSKTSS